MTSLPNLPGTVGIEPDRLAENTARAVNLVDEMLLRARDEEQKLAIAWASLRRDLAEQVVALAREGYIASASVTEALDGEFAAEELHGAGVRLGWFSQPSRGDTTPAAETETDAGQGTWDAIRHCLGESDDDSQASD